MKKFILLLLAFIPAFSFAAAFDPDRACVPLKGVSDWLVVIGAASGVKDFQSSKMIYKGTVMKGGVSVDGKVTTFVNTYSYEMRFKGTHGNVVLITSGQCEYSSDHKDTDPGMYYLLMLEPTEYMAQFHPEFQPPAYDKEHANLWKQYKINEYKNEMSAPF
jgi:hypothetical protein